MLRMKKYYIIKKICQIKYHFLKLFYKRIIKIKIANMWEAVFADVGVTLITIFNTLRILK